MKILDFMFVSRRRLGWCTTLGVVLVLGVPCLIESGLPHPLGIMWALFLWTLGNLVDSGVFGKDKSWRYGRADVLVYLLWLGTGLFAVYLFFHSRFQ